MCTTCYWPASLFHANVSQFKSNRIYTVTQRNCPDLFEGNKQPLLQKNEWMNEWNETHCTVSHEWPTGSNMLPCCYMLINMAFLCPVSLISDHLLHRNCIAGLLTFFFLSLRLLDDSNLDLVTQYEHSYNVNTSVMQLLRLCSEIQTPAVSCTKITYYTGSSRWPILIALRVTSHHIFQCNPI